MPKCKYCFWLLFILPNFLCRSEEVKCLSKVSATKYPFYKHGVTSLFSPFSKLEKSLIIREIINVLGQLKKSTNLCCSAYKNEDLEKTNIFCFLLLPHLQWFKDGAEFYLLLSCLGYRGCFKAFQGGTYFVIPHFISP